VRQPKQDHCTRSSYVPALARSLSAIAAAGLALFVAPAAAWAAPKGSSGSFTFGGEISGSLKVPAFLPPGHILTGCQISPTQAGTEVIQWDTAKLKVGGKTETITNLVIQVDVEKFGHTYSMALDASGSAPGSVTLETDVKYAWMSVSGTVSTSGNGTSGSLKGMLTAGKNHPGTATIKGSWSGCANLG